jgi:hypothetical protein
MALGTRRVWLGLVLAIAGLLAAASRARLPDFWGDGATYYGMAWSLAEDSDLRYETRDLLRVRREFPGGPQGIFIKRSWGGLRLAEAGGFPWFDRVKETDKRLYFAKPFAYPFAAWPFVEAFGTRGLLLANAAFFSLALVLTFLEARSRTTPGRALALALALLALGVAPVYVFWPAPEVFNLAVIAAGLFAWRRARPLLAAALLGLATYSKPYNLWLAIPLGLAPLVGEGAIRGLGRRLLESARRGGVLAAAIALLFAANAAVTGELNYQGGAERKTFYGRFPGEIVDGKEVTFGNSGIWMSVNQLGPKVEGEAAGALEQGAEPPRSPEEYRSSFRRNVYYFWIGRFGGALAYFPAAFAAVLAFLVWGPRSREGWLALLALAVSWVFYLAMIPDNWYGGSGTVGNRYFLNLLPLCLLLVPKGREGLVAVAGVAGAAAFTGTLLLSPIATSLHPGRHAARAPFRWLPAELTMLNDLSVFAERWRWKRPVGDTEGDPHRHWPADPRAYWLYFPDDGTRGLEEVEGGPGFRLRPGASAEVFLRALEPVETVTLHLRAGREGDRVGVRVGGRGSETWLAPGGAQDLTAAPGEPFVYKDSFVYVLRLTSTTPAAGEVTEAGTAVRLELRVNRRPPRGA